jgi:hypothetical protein
MTLSLKGFGYLPPPVEHEMSDFDHDASIAYMGADQLLFTFNLHTLLHRNAEEAGPRLRALSMGN